MNKEAKQQLAEMQLLMERMDNHMTAREANMRKELLKEDLGIGRRNMNSLDELFNEIDLGHSFVGLAYVQGYEADKVYPQKPNYDSDIRGEIGKIDPNSRLAGKMNAFLNDKEYSNPTGRAYAGLRSMASNNFGGILKITNYVFNWGNAESLSNAREKHRLAIADLRRKYGFGEDETSYADDDWRRKIDEKGNSVYGGLGANMQSKGSRKNPDGSYVVQPYHQLLHPDISLYGDTDTYGKPRFGANGAQKRAIKMVLANVNKQWSDYCFVDSNGEIDAVSDSLANLISKAKLPANLLKTITPQMSQDEKDYITAIAELEKNQYRSEKTWLEDNILYIVGTGKNRITGEKTPFRWVNANVNIDKINVNPTELEQIVNSEIQKTCKEII